MSDTPKAGEKTEDKKPGEKQPGKFHYNPGNMSGKVADAEKDPAEQTNNLDRVESRGDAPESRSKT